MSALERVGLPEIQRLCDAVDWNDTITILDRAAEALNLASDPTTLRRLLEHVIESPELVAKCEQFNLFSKVVLSEGAGRRWKLRLHCFGSPILEAHHHRASFCARVVAGSYRHMLFGANATLDRERLKLPLRPLFMQVQHPGSAYMIDHEMVHITLAASDTVSVMLQGPTVTDVFQIYEIGAGSDRLRYGERSKQEVQELGESKMSVNAVHELIDSLARRRVIH